jgi:5-methylthioadenosine/S-adenosylhomocysteine deaminase
MTWDLLIHSGTLVTVNAQFDIIAGGILAIKDDCIDLLAPGTDNQALPEAHQMIDAGGGIVLPGLINTHTHLPMTLFRGLADDLPLMEWLNDYMFPAEMRYLTPEAVRWGTRLACAEMLLSGTTTCCDGYFFEAQVAEAFAEFGLRGVLAQGVIDYPAPGVSDPKENIQHAGEFVDQLAGAYSRVTPSLFCHSPYTCSTKTLQQTKRLANQNNVLFQIHVAETLAEQQQIFDLTGMRPVEYLEKIGLLDANTLLVHGIWLDDADMERIFKSGSAVSHNPDSNMKMASGIAPIPALIQKGITVGLGTDGCASNNTLDMFSAMDLAAKLHKVHSGDPTTMDAAAMLKMATIEAARAIGLGDTIGSLAPGKKADIIIMERCQPHLIPLYHPASQLVYSARGADVRDVIVDGKILVRQGRLIGQDVDNILRQVQRISQTIKNDQGEMVSRP